MKSISFKGIPFIIFLFIAVSSFAQKTVTLKILQTSDVHGSIFPFDYINNKPAESSLAQVYTYVKQERANKKQHVLLLDNGDILQGQPTVYYSNFIDTMNQNIVSQVFNFMGYNAATVGNHDIEAGPKVYNKIRKELNFPWMAANAVTDKDGKPYFTPYTIFKEDGVKIAVLGLITPGIPHWLPKNLWPDMHFESMLTTAKHWISIIKTTENPDIIIGLFHSGHDAKYGDQNPDDILNENSSQIIAQNVPGFDVIFIGHDHDQLNKKFLNISGDSVLILDPTAGARFISEATINISLDKKGKVIGKNIAGKLVPTKTIAADSEFNEKFQKYSKDVETFVNRKIGDFTESTTTKDSYFGPSSFIDFIHTAQLSISNADISFAAPLSFSSFINKGPVYVRDMFKLYRFENFLYVMNLTGKEIDSYLEYSYGNWFNTMKSVDDNLIKFKLKPDQTLDLRKDGKAQLDFNYYNFDSGSGINYTVDVSKPLGDKVTIHSMADGSPFDFDKTYKIATSSFRGNGGGGHLIKGCGIPLDQLNSRLVFSTDKDIRFYIMKWIEEKKIVTPKSLNQWNVEPAQWVKSATERDKVLMFGTKPE
ncbi:MAG: bifunctional UDP-sugar hydrolase/5'-nucleotidase [Tenuifilaceae bacterium]